MKNLRLLPVIFLLGSLIGCNNPGSTDTNDDVIIDATKVYLSNSSASLINGTTYDLNPIVYPYNATKNIKYELSSANPIVMEGNTARAVNIGKTVITIYNDNNNNGVREDNEPSTIFSVEVKVAEEGKSVTVPTTLDMIVGEEQTISYKANGFGSTSENSFGFYSNNDKVATINNKGKIIAHSKGECDISVSYSGYRGICHLTVYNKTDGAGHIYASKIDFKNHELYLEKGQSKTFVLGTDYELFPKNSSKADIRFETTSDILSISGNKITANKEGRALVEVYLNYEPYKDASFIVNVDDKSTTYTGSYYDNYYGNLTWENSSDLWTKLHNIISANVTPLTYNGSKTNWETNKYADTSLYNMSYLSTIYGKDGEILKANSHKEWQREHAFAASLMTGIGTEFAVDTLGRATDFHNLFASNQSGNSARGNKCFDWADSRRADYVESQGYKYTRSYFEPTSENDKGRIARAIFYMALMYDHEATATYTIDSNTSFTYKMPALSILDSNVNYSFIKWEVFSNPSSDLAPFVSALQAKTTGKTVKDAYSLYLSEYQPFAIGKRSTLLEWSTYDVSREEMNHNNSVYSHYSTQGGGTQGNRNPFVDYPELAEYLFGDLQDKPGSLADLRPSSVALEMNKNEVYNYAIGEGAKTQFYVGDTITVADLDLKAVGYDLSVTNAGEDASSFSYTFVAGDAGSKTLTIPTSINELKYTVSVEADANDIDIPNTDYTKPRRFDVNKTYYLSNDGTSFAGTSISSNNLAMVTNISNAATISFVLAENKTDEYVVTFKNGNTSFRLGLNSSGALSSTIKTTNWKIEFIKDYGLVLTEAETLKFVGLTAAGSSNAKAYAHSNLSGTSKYPPLYLCVAK